jgi:glutaredoxin-like protein
MIPLADQDLIRQKFAQELLGQVKIDFFTERELAITVPGKQPCAYCKQAREMLQELAGLSDGISLRVHYLEDSPEEAQRFGIARVPAIVLRGPSTGDAEGRFVIFYGMPSGTEFPTFLEIIADVSRGEVLLSEESLKDLSKITDDVTVRVFVTPTCPYCPAMVRLAYQMTMTNPRIRSEGIEVSEFPDLAELYQVRAVPLTVINDRVAIPGMVDEKTLVEQVVKAAESPLGTPERVEGPTNAVEPAGGASPARVERGKERPSGLYIP